MTHYIVINGPPRSGRSTLARLLQKRLVNSHQAELHASLKHFFCASLALKWSYLALDTPRAELNGRTARDGLRQLRTHLRAVYGPDVLGRWLRFRILGMVPIPKIVIIDDALFPEDVNVLRNGPVTLIRITKGQEKGFVPISNPDYNVINASDIRYLGVRADQIVGGINRDAMEGKYEQA